jgi:hypothetical protein
VVKTGCDIKMAVFCFIAPCSLVEVYRLKKMTAIFIFAAVRTSNFTYDATSPFTRTQFNDILLPGTRKFMYVFQTHIAAEILKQIILQSSEAKRFKCKRVMT